MRGTEGVSHDLMSSQLIGSIAGRARAEGWPPSPSIDPRAGRPDSSAASRACVAPRRRR
jgi:hypothetical protein